MKKRAEKTAIYDTHEQCPECLGTEVGKNGTRVNANGSKYQQLYCKNKDCGFHFRVIKDTVESTVTKKNNKMGITEEQLRMKHDVKFQARKAAEALHKGSFITQSEFITQAGIKPSAGYRDIIEHPNFSKYRGKAGGIVYWGHPDSIKQMKDENVLS